MPHVPTVTPDGTRIRARRLELGLTPEELAARIAPHRHGQTIRAIERGGKKASLRLLGEIATALEVTPAEVVDPRYCADCGNGKRSRGHRLACGGTGQVKAGAA